MTHNASDMFLMLSKMTCCWESGLQIEPIFRDVSFAVKYPQLCSEESYFSAILLWLEYWYQSRTLKFQILVLWLQLVPILTWELSVKYGCVWWRLEPEFNLFNRWDLLEVQLKLRFIIFYRRGWRCWFMKEFDGSPIQLWQVRSWCQQYFWNIQYQNQCWKD